MKTNPIHSYYYYVKKVIDIVLKVTSTPYLDWFDLPKDMIKSITTDYWN